MPKTVAVDIVSIGIMTDTYFLISITAYNKLTTIGTSGYFLKVKNSNKIPQVVIDVQDLRA